MVCGRFVGFLGGFTRSLRLGGPRLGHVAAEFLDWGLGIGGWGLEGMEGMCRVG